MSFLLKILISAIGVIIASYLLPGIHIDSFLTAIIAALVIAILNILIRPLFILLTIPITILSFGIFLLVINAIIILLADWMVSGFIVDGFWWAFLFSIVLSVISYLLGSSNTKKSR